MGLFDILSREETIRLAIAIILGYSILIAAMWIFRKKEKNEEPTDKNEENKRHNSGESKLQSEK